jgi:hypothetical protein
VLCTAGTDTDLYIHYYRLYMYQVLGSLIVYGFNYVYCIFKVGHVGKAIRNTWKVLKCGAGEG